LLALTIDRSDMFGKLEKSKGIDLDDIIFESEIEEQKTKILYHWYADKSIEDTLSNKVVTYDSTVKFIEHATEFAAANLKNHLAI